MTVKYIHTWLSEVKERLRRRKEVRDKLLSFAERIEKEGVDLTWKEERYKEIMEWVKGKPIDQLRDDVQGFGFLYVTMQGHVKVIYLLMALYMMDLNDRKIFIDWGFLHVALGREGNGKLARYLRKRQLTELSPELFAYYLRNQ